MTGQPRPCGLPHHWSGSRVQWNAGLRRVTGRVVWHNPSNRTISVLPDWSDEPEVEPVLLPCSAVGMERLR